jgi:hypothetical protein
MVGGQKEKTLPKWAIEELHENLIKDLRKKVLPDSLINAYQNPWRTSTSVASGSTKKDGWWYSLKGVVGRYEFSIREFDEEGFKIKCWDMWDFNHVDEEIKVPLKINPIIRSILKGSKLEYRIDQKGGLFIKESSLCKYNDKHKFLTRWEDFVTWEELKIDPSEYLRDKENPKGKYYLLLSDSYIVPKWREQQYALSKRGLTDINLFEDWDKLEYFWESIQQDNFEYDEEYYNEEYLE